jgi:hypothetical protein
VTFTQLLTKETIQSAVEDLRQRDDQAYTTYGCLLSILERRCHLAYLSRTELEEGESKFAEISVCNHLMLVNVGFLSTSDSEGIAAEGPEIIHLLVQRCR